MHVTGGVTVYRLFDVGYEIDLTAALECLAKRRFLGSGLRAGVDDPNLLVTNYLRRRAFPRMRLSLIPGILSKCRRLPVTNSSP